MSHIVVNKQTENIKAITFGIRRSWNFLQSVYNNPRSKPEMKRGAFLSFANECDRARISPNKADDLLWSGK